VLSVEEEFRHAILARMWSAEITRSELARRMGVTPARVTQMLRPGCNYTLSTVSRVSKALGCAPPRLTISRPGPRLVALGGWRVDDIGLEYSLAA